MGIFSHLGGNLVKQQLLVVLLNVLADLADSPPVQHRAHLHRVILVPFQALAALGVNERRKQYEWKTQDIKLILDLTQKLALCTLPETASGAISTSLAKFWKRRFSLVSLKGVKVRLLRRFPPPPPPLHQPQSQRLQQLCKLEEWSQQGTWWALFLGGV